MCYALKYRVSPPELCMKYKFEYLNDYNVNVIPIFHLDIWPSPIYEKD